VGAVAPHFKSLQCMGIHLYFPTRPLAASSGGTLTGGRTVTEMKLIAGFLSKYSKSMPRAGCHPVIWPAARFPLRFLHYHCRDCMRGLHASRATGFYAFAAASQIKLFFHILV